MASAAATAEEGAAAEPMRDHVTQSFPPSHILQDGRFIYLPEPDAKEKSKFLERSIARHKLLTEGDLAEEEGDGEGKDDGVGKRGNGKRESEEKKGDSTQPKIHPLAVASARLQANGISELSKAINLSGLVRMNEYFALSNIINPHLHKNIQTQKNEKEPTVNNNDDLRLRSLYIAKRKRSQFEAAAEALERHAKRMAGAIAAQQIVDRRLLQLRPQWRLVAPEHGTRAKAHAARSTEVVAIDVDVYDRDRTGGGIHNNDRKGRLARRVPRYATVELPKDYNIHQDLEDWKNRHELQRRAMEVDTNAAAPKTRAEPFAVADPTLGKIDVDFDPEKVPMLSLQLDIEKDSTGFRQSARLSPLTTLGEDADDDEKVVVALQHSLFCASLFESIQKEIVGQSDQPQNDVWLSSAMEENFLPSISLLVGGKSFGGKGALSIVHCHEGEVKVQLDAEYALTIKLVEAGNTSNNDDKDIKMEIDGRSPNGRSTSSGSESPEQLYALCRALLLHAQEVYHAHSVAMRTFIMKKEKEKGTKKPMGLATKEKKDEYPKAQILQNCVGLGAKMIFERKVRRSLSRVNKWLAKNIGGEEGLAVTWLPLSIFDKQSQFVLSFRNFIVDVGIERDEMVVTRIGEHGEYRKVNFRSEKEFEMFLKLQLEKEIKIQG